MTGSTLLRNLLIPPPERPVPHIAIVFPFEGKIDVEVECDEAERSRLFDYVLADEQRVQLIERAFELAEGGE